MKKSEKFEINAGTNVTKQELVETSKDFLTANGYNIVEIDSEKPWGAYIKLDDNDADNFISEFFPGLDPIDARLGKKDAELSPKILIVEPGKRLSWQYHNRRAERWMFITGGVLERSMTDKESEAIVVQPGEVIELAVGERHRLIGSNNSNTIVAEIWQHTDPDYDSNEEDIVRLQDDFHREEV